MKKLLFCALCTTLLAGCFGYQAMYSRDVVSDVRSVHLKSVQVEDVEHNVAQRRAAQKVAQELRRIFYASENSAEYFLTVSIDEDESTLAVQRDATDQRLQLNLNADVQLFDDADNVVFAVEVNTSAAYNVEDTPFGTDSGRDRARDSAGKSLSDDIISRVSHYLNLKQREE